MIEKQTSFDVDFVGDEDSEHYDDYIQNLKSNNEMTTLALKTAQNLIEQYHRQNVQLKSKVYILEGQLSDKQEEIQYLKGLMLNQQHQSSLQAKIRELIVRNNESEDKITLLTQQLEKCNRRIVKITRLKQGGVQKNLNNYFKFNKNMSQNVVPDQYETFSKEIRSLNWKLQQRDEEINLILRRNRHLQEKISHSIRQQQKLPTCSAQPSKSKQF